MRPDRLRLLDAIEQIEFVRQFALRGREAFFEDSLVQSAILHRLALLGEALRGVSDSVRLASNEIPWAQVIAFRNIVLHQYFALDLDLVWTIVEREITPLAAALNRVLNELPEMD